MGKPQWIETYFATATVTNWKLLANEYDAAKEFVDNSFDYDCLQATCNAIRERVAGIRDPNKKVTMLVCSLEKARMEFNIEAMEDQPTIRFAFRDRIFV